MRRWTPRRPSPELRARIFGATAGGSGAAQALSDFSRWLVPAAGCFLLAVGTLSQRMPGPLSTPETNWVVGTEWNRVDLSVHLAMRESDPDVPHLDPFTASRTILTQPVSSTFSHTNHSIQQ
jgi:hypothetical protein